MDFCIDAKLGMAGSNDLADINSLLKQLSPEARELTWDQLELILARHIFFVFARLGKDFDYYIRSGKIIGMACLVPILIPTGWSGRVEDVIVDEKYRGHGIAKKLIEDLVKSAKSMGLKHLDLTSRPDREAANRLYQRLGFEKRGTNVYRLELA